MQLMKLTEAQSLAIKAKLAKTKITQADLGACFGVSRQHMNAIISGKDYVSKEGFADILKIIGITEKELNELAEYLDK